MAKKIQGKTSVEKLFQICLDNVLRTHGNCARLVGPVIYGALLREQILILTVQQDESISSETARALSNQLYAMSVDYLEGL